MSSFVVTNLMSLRFLLLTCKSITNKKLQQHYIYKEITQEKSVLRCVTLDKPVQSVNLKKQL
jgi:hypothetical protein